MIALLVLALALTAQSSNDPVYRAGGGVSAPRLIYRAEPEYTQAARDAKIEGEVVISAVVDVNGGTRDAKVTRGLGYGLDEAALASVSKWAFRPGMKDGKPVSVAATIVVSFRLASTQKTASGGPQVCADAPQPSKGQAVQAMANQGNAGAQYVMGCAAYRAVPQDSVQAYVWFELAANQGMQKAALARDAVALKMSLGQVSDAQARARAWKPNK